MNELRKNELIRLISETGYTTVKYLAAQLYTSESTIRRNLSELEHLGYVKRSYGGVELYGHDKKVPIKLRYQQNHKQKDSIAKQAVSKLHDNSVIFIDGSTTCICMIPYMKQFKNITVYTNSLEACTLLAEVGISVYSLGGKLLIRSMAFVGEYAVQMVESLYFDDLFFSCGGYANNIVTDYSEPEAHLRRALLKQSRNKYLLCDSSKLNHSCNYIICKASDLTEIITD